MICKTRPFVFLIGSMIVVIMSSFFLWPIGCGQSSTRRGHPGEYDLTHRRLAFLGATIETYFYNDPPGSLAEMLEHEDFKRDLEVDYGVPIKSEDDIVDAWGRRIELRFEDGGSYHLYSTGENGIPGDTDDQAYPYPP